MQNKYDIVIIGSGLGGLSCGYILSKNGYKVAIFEQSKQIGGCLQTFKRRGVKFETGVHYVGSLNPGQILHQFFQYFSLFPNIKLSALDKDGFDVVSFKNQLYKFAVGHDNFVDTFAQKFPHQRDNLQRYVAALKDVAKMSPFYTGNHDMDIYQFNSDYVTTSVNKYIEKIISDETLQSVLVGMLPLYNGVKDKTPWYVHAFINSSNIEGVYRIAGGSDQIATLLTKSIKDFGGDIFAASKVSKIMCNNIKATKIILENGHEIETDHIISSVHPELTVNMIDSNLIRPMYRKRIKQMEQTCSNFTVYMKFKKNKVPYMNHNYFHYDTTDVWSIEKYTKEDWPRAYLYMHLCPLNPSPFADAAEIHTAMRYEDVLHWQGSKVERRGEAYLEFKQQKAEILLTKLERDFPGILSNIESYYTSSPLTYLDYTGTKEGASYGIQRDINVPRMVHRTKIPNLFLTGQSVSAHGVIGVIVGAIITCSEFLGRDFILKQISNS
jgi:all-trans-retinol 13,14-reductase